jgi:glutathione S-transferase
MKQFNLNFVERKVQLCTKSTNNILSEYNSDYKVPILKVDGLVVWDSLAILEYLSEWQINGSGWPTSVSMRAIARSMVAEMHSSFTNIRDIPFQNLHILSILE